jgi:hypothetical protein
VSLVVDLVDRFDRMVEEDALVVALLGVAVPRCPVPRAGLVDSRHQMLLVREALRGLSPSPRGTRKKST